MLAQNTTLCHTKQRQIIAMHTKNVIRSIKRISQEKKLIEEFNNPYNFENYK